MDVAERIELLRQHLIEKGHKPLECVEHFQVGEGDETFVAHFSMAQETIPGEEGYTYIDTPSTVVAMLDLQTGKISIPEMF